MPDPLPSDLEVLALRVAEKAAEKAALLAKADQAEAVTAAVERGRLAAVVDGRLSEHDRHLASINGSIGHLATGMDAVNDKIDDVGDATKTVGETLTGYIEAQEKRDKEQEKRDAKAISERRFNRNAMIALCGIGVSSGTGILIAIITSTH